MGGRTAGSNFDKFYRSPAPDLRRWAIGPATRSSAAISGRISDQLPQGAGHSGRGGRKWLIFIGDHRGPILASRLLALTRAPTQAAQTWWLGVLLIAHGDRQMGDKRRAGIITRTFIKLETKVRDREVPNNKGFGGTRICERLILGAGTTTGMPHDTQSPS